ncbi:MAG: hypothetical protein QXU98_13385, partial [Candidatus Parvarchaeota archaeon]
MKSGELIIRLLLLNLLLTSIILVATGIKADSSVSAQPIGQATVYTAPYTATSFVLNTTVNPINTIASNIRLFKYPNLTGPIQAFVSQGWSAISSGSYPSSRIIKVVPGSGVSGVYPDYLFNGSLFRVGSVVESTSWGSSPRPYYEGNLLVINATGVSAAGQYIGWAFTPSTTTLNVTIHVVSFPVYSSASGPGIELFSQTVGNQSTDGNGGFYVLLVDFYDGAMWYHGPSTSWQKLYSTLPEPNPNYPFTFTVIYTENSAGNVTVAEVGINGTYTTININTQFPWSQISYVAIRGNINNLFYVSYFAASSGSVSAQFVPTPSIGEAVKSLSLVESTGWGSAPKPYYQGNLLVFNTTGSTYGQYIGWAFMPSTTVLNATIHVVSFPDHNNYYVGIGIYSPNMGNQTGDGASGTYVMQIDFLGPTIWYHGPSANWQELYGSLPQPNPNYPFTFTVILTENSAGNVTVSEVGINGTYTTINVNTPFPWSEIGYVAIRGDINDLFYVSYFAASSGSVSAQFVPPRELQYPSFVESTAWYSAPRPYYKGNLLVFNATDSGGGQYMAWAFTPPTTTLNITIHVTSFPYWNGNPGIDLLSPNVGNQSSDGDSGFYVLLVDFHVGYIWYHGPSTGWQALYTSLPQPNPSYPFTFTVILTENSAGNVTVSEVGINGTYTTVNVNTPLPWTEIGYVGIRADPNTLYYVSYFAAATGQPGTYPVVFVPSYTVNANPFPIFHFPSTITQAYLVYNNNSVFLSAVDAGGQFFLNIPLKMQWEPFTYFGLSAYQLLTVVNAPTTGYLAAFPYPLTYNYFTSPGPFTSVPSTVITPTFSKTTYPLTNVSIQQLTLLTSAGSVTTSTQAYVLPNIGAWTYASVQYPTTVSVIVNNTVQKLSVSGASVTVSASYSTTVIAPDNLIPPP